MEIQQQSYSMIVNGEKKMYSLMLFELYLKRIINIFVNLVKH